MFFGMCNSPATFQAMIDDIFEDLIKEGIVIIYMDDMFLSAKTKEQLRENTKRVLQWLMENDLYLKPKKCEFCKEKIEWLGMVIQEGKITMDPRKLKGIQDWPAPTTVKQGKLNWRQARWSLYLSEFDVKLVHITGTKIVQLDGTQTGPNQNDRTEKE